ELALREADVALLCSVDQQHHEAASTRARRNAPPADRTGGEYISAHRARRLARASVRSAITRSCRSGRGCPSAPTMRRSQLPSGSIRQAETSSLKPNSKKR